MVVFRLKGENELTEKVIVRLSSINLLSNLNEFLHSFWKDWITEATFMLFPHLWKANT